MDKFQDIWMYVNVHGKLKEVPAFISKAKPSKWAFTISAFDRDNYNYLREIAREPGMIFLNSIWFKKKNFKKAKEIFLLEYGSRLKDFQDNYKQNEDEMSKLADQEIPEE